MTPTHAVENHLLATLPEAVYAALEPHFERVHLTAGEVLNAVSQQAAHVYFPLTAIVSCVYVLANGDSTEIAMTGLEGMVGLHLLGSRSTHYLAMVQTTGAAIRIRLPAVLDSFNNDLGVQRILLRFMEALLAQMGQATVCKQHHNTDEQLCRFLLSIMDRQNQTHLQMTHEWMSQLLGVRREAVSLAAARLMKEGLIRYSRGRIDILDRHGLAERTCECYGVVKHQYQALLNWPVQQMDLPLD